MSSIAQVSNKSQTTIREVLVNLMRKYPASETKFIIQKESTSLCSSIYTWLFFFLLYAVSISSLFYDDHASDEATAGVQPEGNQKEGNFIQTGGALWLTDLTTSDSL